MSLFLKNGIIYNDYGLREEKELDILKAIVMGLIQGITEFLPVSSSGHLAIFSKIFKMELDSTILFEVMLHFGTLVSIIVVFREDIWRLLREFFYILLTCIANFCIWIKRISGDKSYKYIKVISNSYRKLVIFVIVSSIPTAILGFLSADLVEKASGSLLVVGICMMITAVVLVIADVLPRGKDHIKDVPYSGAFLLGIAQGIATFPGISRSGATISCGMMIGMTKKTAVRYSFIMSIPVVLGATILKLFDLSSEPVNVAQVPAYVVGTLVAGITGYFSIKYMLKMVRRHRYYGFAVYCAVLSVVAIVFSIINR